MCFDGTKRLCHIRGKLRKRQWINTSDIILVGLREYQDAKADVIMKYNGDEARRLKNMGHLPDSVNIDVDTTTLSSKMTSLAMRNSMWRRNLTNRKSAIARRVKRANPTIFEGKRNTGHSRNRRA